MKRKIVVLVLLLLLSSVTQVGAKVAELCIGSVAQDRTPIYLGDDNNDWPVYLVVFYSQNYDHFATLFAATEYPQGSGDYYYFQPAGATLRREVQKVMEWSSVSVTVTACSQFEVRYIITQDTEPDA